MGLSWNPASAQVEPVTVSWTWKLSELDTLVTMHRWGEMGVPVLVFPPDGVDAAEIERSGLVASLSLLMADRRVKVYAVDSVVGRGWSESEDPLHAAWIQNRFGAAVGNEIVPRIRQDCRSDSIEVVAVGAALGAMEAVAAVCRHPDLFLAAVGMSGSYDPTPRLRGFWSDDVYFSSPIHFVPGLNGDGLDRLRGRRTILATGTGSWENPGETWWMADVLTSKSIPHRVDNWPGYARDWSTWQAMLPGYLHELVP